MYKILAGAVFVCIVLVGGYFLLRGEGGGNTSTLTSGIAVPRQFATSTAPTPSVSTSTLDVQATPISNKSIQQNKKFMEAVLHTNKGDIAIEFFPDQAPNTVANFQKLAQSGFYDQTKFHRVIADFMIQGGDPLSKDDSKMAQWGMGGPGYQFNDEITAKNSNVIGTIAMANSGPNTNGSQFFINTADNHFLDSKHTVFGHVVAGLDVVKIIGTTPTNTPLNDMPKEPIIISSITLK